MPMSQETAETIGIKALAWLAAQDDLLPVFLGATGACEKDIRAGVANPDFLGAVLDFLLMDDAWVKSMCEAHALAYDQPMMARAMLPGGAAVHWT